MPVAPSRTGSALHPQSEGIRDVASAVNDNVATALFDLLEAFPWTFATSLVGIVLVMSFFVTSSDSGSLVVDHLTSGGKLESRQRVVGEPRPNPVVLQRVHPALIPKSAALGATHGVLNGLAFLGAKEKSA